MLFESLAQKTRGEAQQKPEEGKQRANLPQYIQPPRAVIPNIPMEQTVDEQTDRKLQKGYQQTTERTAQPKRTRFAFFVDTVNAQQRRAARHAHCPMRKPAKQDFNQAVEQCAERIHTKIFPKFFHRITANSMVESVRVYPSGERGFYESQIVYARLQGQSV